MLLNSDIKILAELDFRDYNIFKVGYLDFDLSGDHSKLLILHQLPNKKNTAERICMHVFDANMNNLWKKEITLPYTEDLFGIEDFMIDPKGNVYVLGYKTDKGKNNSKRIYHILSYSQNKQEIDIPIDLKGKFIEDMQIIIDNDNDILCTGFYSNKGLSSIDGTYFIRINKNTKQVLNEVQNEFSIEFLTLYTSQKEKKKTARKVKNDEDVELKYINLKDVEITDKGEIIMVGEYQTVQSKAYSNLTNKDDLTVYTESNYNDIVIVKLSNEGKLLWAQKIPKRHKSVYNDCIFR